MLGLRCSGTSCRGEKICTDQLQTETASSFLGKKCQETATRAKRCKETATGARRDVMDDAKRLPWRQRDADS